MGMKSRLTVAFCVIVDPFPFVPPGAQGSQPCGHLGGAVPGAGAPCVCAKCH